MSNLTPEKRMNKNGVMVTKHVKAVATAPSSQLLPAPSMKAENTKKPFKPSPKQATVRDLACYLQYTEADAELTDKLATGGDHYGKARVSEFRLNASEAQFYDVHSVASMGNTAVMMRAGVRSKEEALELLDSLHLGRLVAGNSEMTQAMLDNKVSFEQYTEFRRDCDFDEEDTDPQAYADAATIHAVKGYRSLMTDTVHSAYEEVIDGRLSASDIKTIGLGRFQNALSSDPIFKALAAIKSGETDYNALQLAVFLDRASGEVGYTTALRMADAYGMDFVSGLTSMWKAQAIHDNMEESVEERRKAISYADEIEGLTDPNKPYSIATNDVLKLYRAEVSPELAVEQTEAGLTPEQIIAIHKEGIASSIASGFL